LKIPSIVLYDSSGVAKAFCAESEDEFIEIQVRREFKFSSEVKDSLG
jgi:hypothetical protein